LRRVPGAQQHPMGGIHLGESHLILENTLISYVEQTPGSDQNRRTSLLRVCERGS
jgi:hypothetical protein